MGSPPSRRRRRGLGTARCSWRRRGTARRRLSSGAGSHPGAGGGSGMSPRLPHASSRAPRSMGPITGHGLASDHRSTTAIPIVEGPRPLCPCRRAALEDLPLPAACDAAPLCAPYTDRLLDLRPRHGPAAGGGVGVWGGGQGDLPRLGGDRAPHTKRLTQRPAVVHSVRTAPPLCGFVGTVGRRGKGGGARVPEGTACPRPPSMRGSGCRSSPT